MCVDGGGGRGDVKRNKNVIQYYSISTLVVDFRCPFNSFPRSTMRVIKQLIWKCGHHRVKKPVYSYSYSYELRIHTPSWSVIRNDGKYNCLWEINELKNKTMTGWRNKAHKANDASSWWHDNCMVTWLHESILDLLWLWLVIPWCVTDRSMDWQNDRPVDCLIELRRCVKRA